MKKILLIGGGGYIGTLMTEEYSKNKNISQVNSLDWLIYKSQKINKKLLKNKKIKFFYGDFRNKKILEKSLKDVTDVIILAGLVGDPITKKYKSLSDKINLYGIKKLINKLKDNTKINKLIFISTCSNYGIVKKKLANEKTKLSPKSHYAKAKVEVEKYILGLKKKNFFPVILRFATAFGFSQRMRYDLTINEFCRDMYNNKELIVYDPYTWRPYCHVKDFSRIVNKVLFSPNHIVNNQVFNVGSNKNNYRKKDIVNLIKKYKKKAKVKYLERSVDPRDYRVDFKKITKVLNIKPRYSADYGIKEIFKKLKLNRKSSDNGNYIIKSNVK
jgi:nucleoside-diphosphate-sugar epimerase